MGLVFLKPDSVEELDDIKLPEEDITFFYIPKIKNKANEIQTDGQGYEADLDRETEGF